MGFWPKNAEKWTDYHCTTSTLPVRYQSIGTTEQNRTRQDKKIIRERKVDV